MTEQACDQQNHREQCDGSQCARKGVSYGKSHR